MKNNLLVVDVDDTVVHWTKHYIDWLFTYKIQHIDTHNPNSWFNKDYIDQFNYQSDSFLYRHKIQSMCNIIEAIKEDSGCEVLFLSACGEVAHDRQSKVLDKCNFTFNYKFETVEASHQKLIYINNIKHNYSSVVLLDDKEETVQGFIDNGIKAYSSKNIRLIYNNVLSEFGKHFHIGI